MTSNLLEDTKARVTLRDSQDYPSEGFAAMENDQCVLGGTSSCLQAGERKRRLHFIDPACIR